MTNWQEKMRQLARSKANKWIIVAITGVTNSGKTSLASNLKKTLQPSVTVNQDPFFRSEDDPNHVWVDLVPPRRHQNWERLECVNWDAMCERICQVLAQPVTSGAKHGFLFLDGHIVLNYRPIAEICHEKFFIDLDKETVLSRRVHRNYIPADPPGYFEQWVWPMYVKNKEELKDQKDIKYIDGSQSIDTIFRLVYNKLKSYSNRVDVVHKLIKVIIIIPHDLTVVSNLENTLL